MKQRLEQLPGRPEITAISPEVIAQEVVRTEQSLLSQASERFRGDSRFLLLAAFFSYSSEVLAETPPLTAETIPASEQQAEADYFTAEQAEFQAAVFDIISSGSNFNDNAAVLNTFSTTPDSFLAGELFRSQALDCVLISDFLIQQSKGVMQASPSDPNNELQRQLLDSSLTSYTFHPRYGYYKVSADGKNYIFYIDNWLTGQNVYTSQPLALADSLTADHQPTPYLQNWAGQIASELPQILMQDYYQADNEAFQTYRETMPPEIQVAKEAPANTEIGELMRDYQMTIRIYNQQQPQDSSLGIRSFTIGSDFLEATDSRPLLIDGEIVDVRLLGHFNNTHPRYNEIAQAASGERSFYQYNISQPDYYISVTRCIVEMKHGDQPPEYIETFEFSVPIFLGDSNTESDYRSLDLSFAEQRLTGYLQQRVLMPFASQDGYNLYSTVTDRGSGRKAAIQEKLKQLNFRMVEDSFGLPPQSLIKQILIFDSQFRNGNAFYCYPYETRLVSLTDEAIEHYSLETLQTLFFHEGIHILILNLGLQSSMDLQAHFLNLRYQGNRDYFEALTDSSWYNLPEGGHPKDDLGEYLTSLLNTVVDPNWEARVNQLSEANKRQYLEDLIVFRESLNALDEKVVAANRPLVESSQRILDAKIVFLQKLF